MIERDITKQISHRLKDNKVIVIVGPRQVGKTTILEDFFVNENTLVLDGDDTSHRALLTNRSTQELRHTIGKHKRLIIDEAQRIENIGITLKQIHDRIEGVKVIASGSSSLEIANQINEPLTGRKWEYIMYPLSIQEMINHTSQIQESSMLEHRLVYGYYPDVINHPGEEKDILLQLSDSYLFKDLLMWENIKKPQKLEKLVQALAFQIGSQVSYHELGQITGLNNETVERYIQLLEKAFVIFRLSTLSRNLRNELKKTRKIYFYDVGLRNAVIRNFNPVPLRQDLGALWENFLIVERMKHKAYNKIYTNNYFWRTQAQQEIDYIEEMNGTLHAYEFKWNAKRKIKFSKSFTNAYPNHLTMGVNRENYMEFVHK